MKFHYHSVAYACPQVLKGAAASAVVNAVRRIPGRNKIRNLGYGVMAAPAVGGAAAYAIGKRGGRRRSYKKRSQGSEIKRVKTSTVGRKPKATIGRMMRLSVPARTLIFQGYKKQDNADAQAGYFLMMNQVSASTSSTYMPCYVFGLNATNQSANASPFRVARLHSTGRVEWVTSFGLSLDTTSSSTWRLETNEVGTDVLTNDEFSKIAQMWYSVKLALYGAKTQQTTYVIELITPTKDYAAIEDESELLSMTGTHADRYRDEVYGYWQNKLRALTTSPIAPNFNAQRNPRQQPYKTLRRWTYTIRPSTTIESDSSPNATIAKLFINDGRVLDYQWSKPNGAYNSTNTDVAAGIDDYLQTPGYVNQAVVGGSMGVTIMNNPQPQQRRYLVIRAVNTTAIPSGSETNDNTPSFDMVIRKKELCGPGN